MATKKSNQAAPDGAIEKLLTEIANTAYLTELTLQASSSDVKELYELQVDQLRNVVARMGWMADVALSRLGSINSVYEGNAAAWMLPLACFEALAQKVQP